MHINELDHDRLRQLAALRPERGKVLSVYLNLDPAQFGTQPARASAISSLLDEADRRTRDADGMDHDTLVALREDVERVGEFLRGDDFSPKGAHGVAVFACGPAGLFEAVRLADAVPGAVVVNDHPWIDPLIGRERRNRCLALVSRRTLRVFADAADGDLREVGDLVDEVHGQHEQGGWSQGRYERGIEEQVREHLKRVAEVLAAFHGRRSVDVLAIGTSAELWPELERMLDAELRDRTLGRFDVEVEHASAEDVLEAARPLLERAEEQHLQRLFERLQAGVGTGERVAIGIAPVLEALTERRVEALLYEPGVQAPGYVCPEAGWLGLDVTGCPLGAEQAVREENVLDVAIAAALMQSAEVVALRDRPELGPLGGVAALLRF